MKTQDDMIVTMTIGELRQIIKEEIKQTLSETIITNELPPLLTRKELKQLFHIGETKTSELLGRADSRYLGKPVYLFQRSNYLSG